MNSKKVVSKVDINKPITSARIQGRLQRLLIAREQAVAKKNTDRVQALSAEIARYRTMAHELAQQLEDL